MIKTPKLFFYDVGLATYLLGISNTEQLFRDPLRGHLVENLVILELMKDRLNKGLDPQLYYFRDLHGREVDVIFQSGRQLFPIEIKASETFNPDFFKNIDFFRDLTADRCGVGTLIYAGKQQQSGKTHRILNYKKAAQAILDT